MLPKAEVVGLAVAAKGLASAAPDVPPNMLVVVAVGGDFVSLSVGFVFVEPSCPNGLAEEDEVPIVPNGEALEEASLPNPEAANAEADVCGWGGGDFEEVMLARDAKGDIAEAFANPEVGGI